MNLIESGKITDYDIPDEIYEKFTETVKNKERKHEKKTREKNKKTAHWGFHHDITTMKTSHYNTELLYRINLDKLRDGCKKNWFARRIPHMVYRLAISFLMRPNQYILFKYFST